MKVRGMWIAARVALAAATVAVGVAVGCSSGSSGTVPDASTSNEASVCVSSTQVVCSGECSDLQKDPSNCGACGTACKAGELCSQGKCATSCGGGTTQCGQTCTIVADDPANCGACGTACTSGQACVAGKCVSTCGATETVCNGNCVNTKTDNANCGTCGTTCASGEACSNGTCAATCQNGLNLCNAPVVDGGVTDAATDADAEADAQTDGGLSYPYCANFQTDNANCGACGVTCSSGEQCVNGACSTTCGPPNTECTPDGGTPYCANTQSDNENCGACGTACSFGTSCILGSCKPAIKVGVEGGSFYTDTIRAYLATQPGIASATEITACDTTTLAAYDVVIVYGNMTCFSDANYTSYVSSGGGLIGTPWIFGNNGGITALPVTQGGTYTPNFHSTLNVTVTNASDPLLANVTFNTTDAVGYESFAFTLNTGATSSSYWNDAQTPIATAKWAYGNGRAVYLDFHYITSDCSLASSYTWGQQLMYNSVLWASKRE